MKDVFLLLLSCVVTTILVYGVGDLITWEFKQETYSIYTAIVLWLFGFVWSVISAIGECNG